MKTRVSIIISTYSLSGVPLAQLRLAKALARRGYEVDYIVGSNWDTSIDLPVASGVNVINLNKPRVLRTLFPLIRYLMHNRPGIIFSSEDYLNAIVVLSVVISMTDCKLALSSRVTPHDAYPRSIFLRGISAYCKGLFMRVLNPLLWSRADVLSCVCNDMVKQYHALFGQTRHQTLYNIIVDLEFQAKKQEEVDHPWFSKKEAPIIIAAGRLAPEKGFIDLIRAVKIVNDSKPVRLVILGGDEDHELKARLLTLVDSLQLLDRVQLLGFQPNPYKFFSRSNVFVLSSYSEGLPNVLVEAMACGCPVVSTDCPTGPREVLKDGRFGELVPVAAPQAMAEAILRALASPRTFDEFSEAVLPFTEARAIQAYLRAFGLEEPGVIN